MQYTGLTVSRICLGMMTCGTPQWRPWVLDEAASKLLASRIRSSGIPEAAPGARRRMLAASKLSGCQA